MASDEVVVLDRPTRVRPASDTTKICALTFLSAQHKAALVAPNPLKPE